MNQTVERKLRYHKHAGKNTIGMTVYGGNKVLNEYKSRRQSDSHTSTDVSQNYQRRRRKRVDAK